MMDQCVVYTSLNSARSIDVVSSYTSEVVSVHSIGSLAALTQRETDPIMLGAEFEWLILSRRLEMLGKEPYLRYSNQFQLYSGE